MFNILKSIGKLIYKDKVSLKFALGVLFGLGFSIAVILCTIGIMDGFSITLKRGLKKSSADIILFSHTGFFKYDQNLKNIFSSLNVGETGPAIKTQGFLTAGEVAKGVEVNGIELESFNKTTGMHLNIARDEIAIGTVLAKQLNLKSGDLLSLALPKGNQSFSSLPLIKEFKVGEIIDHGIYQKNLRLVYLQLPILQTLLGVDDSINLIYLNHAKSKNSSLESPIYAKRVKNLRILLHRELGEEYRIRPYWAEFASLLEVVEIEKLIIGLILQMVVVISIFNVLAFVIFINEKKAKELFLYKALGLSQKRLIKVWFWVILSIWAAGSLLSILLVKIFNYMLQSFSLFLLPGDIYHLGRLNIILGYTEYTLVFGLTLAWLFIVSWLAIIRLKKSLLANLRREFS